MTAPVLSICIPTYNRAPFLHDLLQFAATWKFSFPYEIIISDNASTDETPQIAWDFGQRGLPIRYYRQSVNKGGGANCMAAFHRARGQYVMFLADDDRLVLDGVENAIAYLRARPQIRALYAPWEVYDAVNEKVLSHFYTLEQDVIFSPGQEPDLLQLVLSRHIFPEHMIYRADAARLAIAEPQFCYFAFSHLAHAIAHGPIAFIRAPYYRSVVVTTIARDRARLGNLQAMTEWDVYRGGLEYFVYILLKRRGAAPGPEWRDEFRNKIDAFVRLRMEVAFNLWRGQQDFVRAYEILVRMNYLDPAGAAKTGNVAEIQLFACIQSLARLTNQMAGIQRLVIVGGEQPENLASALGVLGLDKSIAVLCAAEPPDDEAVDRSVVYIASEGDREKALRSGYAPGLVISHQDLSANIFLN